MTAAMTVVVTAALKAIALAYAEDGFSVLLTYALVPALGTLLLPILSSERAA